MPFYAETMPALCGMVLDRDAPSPGIRQFKPELSEELEQVVLKCIAKDVNKRYADVQAMAHDLAPFAGDLGYQSAERVARILGAAGLGMTIRQPSLADISSSARVGARTSAPRVNTSTAFSGTDHGTGAVAPKKPPTALYLGAAVALAGVVGIGAWVARGSGNAPAAGAAEPPRPTASAPAVTASAAAPPAASPTAPTTAPPSASVAPSAAIPVAGAVPPRVGGPRPGGPVAAPPPKGDKAAPPPPKPGGGSVFDDRQ
jgi:hypothetical protein